jgi:hypothetical protein
VDNAEVHSEVIATIFASDMCCVGLHYHAKGFGMLKQHLGKLLIKQ